MDGKEAVSAYKKAFGIGEVAVCGIEADPPMLHGVNGCVYLEAEGNIWMSLDEKADVAYVGTCRHAGGVVLRPLFVKVDGVWRNAFTGRESDFSHWEKATDSLVVCG
ncbi:MAG: hypothetical protein J5818_06765 [Eggerthellaceae bacterium]|nr:hypothetical protein [Eggerthellaceae bacterium]